jgi:hypothetical protein
VARLVRWLPVVLCVGLAVLAASWVLAGGRLLVLRSPSMGTTAQAGSLVMTRPLGSTPLHRGMIVAFDVPGIGTPYMHRIAAILPDGKFRTRGDLNTADDGWQLTRSQIVGVPVLIVPIAGWLALGLPWALGVLALGITIGVLAPHASRPALRALTVGAALALPLYVLRPLVRVTIVASRFVTPAAGHLTHRATVHAAPLTAKLFVARLVNRGVLPLRVTFESAHTVIDPGHAGIIRAPLSTHVTPTLSAHAVIPPWGWAIVVAFVLAPLLAAMTGGRRRRARRDRRRLTPAAAPVQPASNPTPDRARLATTYAPSSHPRGSATIGTLAPATPLMRKRGSHEPGRRPARRAKHAAVHRARSFR